MSVSFEYQEVQQGFSQILQEGGICGVPTETVYGLAGSAYDDRVIAEIFSLKGRPSFNPLILHYKDVFSLQDDVVWPSKATKLAKAFWPGPLTLVLNRSLKTQISTLASAGLATVAVRIPAHPIFLDLLKTLPFPLAAPSANPSGRLSPTKASHVRESFPSLPLLDGGDCFLGLESTVINLTKNHPILLRPGALPVEEIELVLGEKVQCSQLASSDPQVFYSPGMLASHYAPLKPLRMNAQSVDAQEGLLAFGPSVLPGSLLTLNLSPKSNLVEAASLFFDYLHQLEASLCGGIAVMPIPEEGLGIALNDRLKRACGRMH
jgi:L-threonylcarbamoyladenylate synthase